MKQLNDVSKLLFILSMCIVCLLNYNCRKTTTLETARKKTDYYDLVASDCLTGYHIARIRKKQTSSYLIVKLNKNRDRAIASISPEIVVEKNFNGKDTITLECLRHFAAMDTDYFYSDSVYTRFRLNTKDSIYEIFKGQPREKMYSSGIDIMKSRELNDGWRYVGTQRHR